MPNLVITGIAPDVTELDIEFSNPPDDLSEEVLVWRPLKTVTVASLPVSVIPGVRVVQLAAGEDMPGRSFRTVAARMDGVVRVTSKPSPYDYHNRTPFTAGTVKCMFVVGQQKNGRIDLSQYLFDPDRRDVKIVLVGLGEPGYADDKPVWATLEGNVLVIDTSVPRASVTLAVRLTDEKAASATLDVEVSVVPATAPAAPTGLVYNP